MTTEAQRLQADLQAIHELHEADRHAARSGDYAALRKLFTEDAVILPPGGVVLRGRDAIEEAFSRMTATPSTDVVLEYEYVPEEVQVHGDFAHEWGVFRGRVRRPDGTQAVETCKAMRILKRLPSGEWRIHRTMWNAVEVEMPPEPGA